jgi:flagellar protein FliO/FliZ
MRQEKRRSELTDGLGMLSIKMFLSLLLMLGLIYALYYIMKRLKIGPLTGGRPASMKLLGTLSLAPKRGIALVEVCDQWFVVGIGSENVNLISKVKRPEGGTPSNTGPAASGTMFQSILENIGLSGKSSVTRTKD